MIVRKPDYGETPLSPSEVEFLHKCHELLAPNVASHDVSFGASNTKTFGLQNWQKSAMEFKQNIFMVSK